VSVLFRLWHALVAAEQNLVNDGVLRKITGDHLVFMLSALFPFEADGEFGSFDYVLAL